MQCGVYGIINRKGIQDNNKKQRVRPIKNRREEIQKEIRGTKISINGRKNEEKEINVQ
jgi:uncharacterized protein YajQ (UPF0234 family)